MHGWIILDKPTGISSAQAVARVKRIVARCSLSVAGENTSNQQLATSNVKIGHAGTLDPLASGILPLALGEATKTIPYMVDADKEYAFTVAWGEERSTDDREGEITASSDRRPTEAEIAAILPRFIGNIEQIPPNFSAIKVDGQRAYAIARSGQEMPELKPRRVRVDSLELSSPLEGERLSVSPERTKGEAWGDVQYHSEPPPTAQAALRLLSPAPPQGGSFNSFICHCGKGTYIRSIARDMGRILGCFGHISSLRRLKVGAFGEDQAISLELLEKIVHKEPLNLVRPVESALDDIPALEVNSNQAMRLQRGQSSPVERVVSNGTVLARCEGKLVAICEYSLGMMKPVRVFNL